MGKECECNCSICKSACMRKPGWMIPQDIINISEYLKMGMEEVFKKYLSIDYYARPLSKGGHIFVLSPCSTDNAPGEVWPRNPLGKCIFFKDDICSIPSASPFECREYMHYDSIEVSNKRHREIALMWDTKENQKIIRSLYGKDVITIECFSLKM